jgi:hypothetical protein
MVYTLFFLVSSTTFLLTLLDAVDTVDNGAALGACCGVLLGAPDLGAAVDFFTGILLCIK